MSRRLATALIVVGAVSGCQPSAPQEKDGSLSPVDFAIDATRQVDATLEPDYRGVVDSDTLRDRLAPKVTDDALREVVRRRDLGEFRLGVLAIWYFGREARLGVDFLILVLNQDDRKLSTLMLSFANSYVAHGGRFNESLSPLIEVISEKRRKGLLNRGSYYLRLLKEVDSPTSLRLLVEVSNTGRPTEKEVAHSLLSELRGK